MNHTLLKGTLLGTPNREPQENSRYIIGIYLPGSLYSIIFLLYSRGSLFGVPSRVPLLLKLCQVLSISSIPRGTKAECHQNSSNRMPTGNCLQVPLNPTFRV